MKNKIIGIFCMVPLTALIMFVVVKAFPVVVLRLGESAQGITLWNWAVAVLISAGLFGIVALFIYGWRKFTDYWL